MKDGAPEPTHHAEVAKQAVIRHERIVPGNIAPKRLKTGIVRVAIEDAEKNTEWLLHTKEALEWPFAVKLLNGLTTLDTVGSHRALASVIAFSGACP